MGTTVRCVDWEDEGLRVWETSLCLAEDELRDREQRALAADPSSAARLAIAAEHDKIAQHLDALADMQDERAAARDVAGLRRDVKGSTRDRRARAVKRDLDSAFPDRSVAGVDRDYAAGDRGDSYGDRNRAHQAREHAAADRARAADDRDHAAQRAAEQARQLDELRAALESRLVIGQAQGLLMARHHLSSQDAFTALVRLSQDGSVKMRDVAARLVAAEESIPERGRS